MDEENTPGEMYLEGMLLLNKENDDDRGASIKKAVELFKKAGEMGHLPSKRAMGFLYLNGTGVEKDIEKAYELISEAAMSMDPLAMYALGNMYERGLGVEQDDREALRLFSFAAEMGLQEAIEDAERLGSLMAERRSRKLRSRPILNLEISDVDVEAACCKKMYDSVLEGIIEVVETYKGPELVGVDENEFEVIYKECPFCGKPVIKVSRNKIY